jgi:hypothetical protein
VRILLEGHGFRVGRIATEPKRVAADFLLRKALRSARMGGLEPYLGWIPLKGSINVDLGDILTVCAFSKRRDGP